ncbi:MAG: hypothetical protein IJ160_08485 [Muribaculaceae bacterium]|nr:hypothetical protein [Muribaculaceae bacterium]
MRQIQSLNALRRAGTCIVFALVGLAAASQQMIDLAKTPVLCNQTHTFKLKEVLPDGYSYYCDSEGTEIVLTRDQGKANRYTSKFPQSPYIHSCDYVVKKLGQTVTMIACLEQYQEENPYYVLFAANSPEAYSKQWQERINKSANNSDWLLSVPIDADFVTGLDIDLLQQMRLRLKKADQSDELVKFNVNQLDTIISSYEEADDCEAE